MSWNRGQYFGGKKDGCADHSGRRHEPSVVEDESQLPEHERCGNMHALSFASICARLDRAEAPYNQSCEARRSCDRELLKAAGKQSLYPVVRLLCTSLDVGRRNFGLKEKGLAQLYLQLTGLKGADPAKNKAAGKLHFFAGTASARGTHMGAGDGAALKGSAEGPRAADGDMTLGEVRVPRPARALTKSDARGTFEKVYRLSSASTRPLARVIIGNREIGRPRGQHDLQAPAPVGEGPVCGVPEPPKKSAPSTPWAARAQRRGDARGPRRARRVLQADARARRAERRRPGDAHRAGLQRVAKKRFGIEGVPPITCEVKLDGERIMAHLVNGEIRLWTRSPTDYTSHYGPCISETLLKCLHGATRRSWTASASRCAHADGRVRALRVEPDLFARRA